eukprot:TRINITY_DN11441_c0_g1_i1.p1 TRINITY_DN11441_c0_g1~~TRINITY_DN11441_c0_g1_i1.p1  ORF type:complete len:260 (-),score=30.09 TRINITY_DN11441_c0_g1_i1:13-714(-)
MYIVNMSLSIALIFIGAVWVIFGYRLFKIVLFVAGFIVFYFITFRLLTIYASASIYLWAMYVIAAIVGLIGGALFIVIHVVGFFLFGMFFGILFGLLLFASTPLGDIHFNEWYYPILVIIGCGLIPGILAVFFSRFIIMVGTSFNGSFLVFHGIDSLWIHSSLATLLQNIFKPNHNPVDTIIGEHDWRAYVFLAAIVLLTIFGVFIQYRLTAPKSEEERDRQELQPLLTQSDV